MVAAAHAQVVLVGAGVVLGGHFGVVQGALQRKGAGLGLRSVVQLQHQAIADGAQGFHVHPVGQSLDDVGGQHVLARQVFQCRAADGGLAFASA